MEWFQGRLYTNSEGIEPLTGFLMEQGVTNTQIDDEAENRRFLIENPDKWDYIDETLMTGETSPVSVLFWIPSNSGGLELIETLKSKLPVSGVDYVSFEIEIVDDSSWLNEWKKYYKPLKIGQHVVVCPEWEQYEPQPNELVFVINPGHVFGTGLHQTTQMCIECLAKYVTPGCTILDIGSGSGILSIIGMMLGASSAFGCDLDISAADIANRNARLNNIPSESYQVVTGNAITDEDLRTEILSKPKFDIIVANIVADAILALAETAANCVKPNGFFISSGIITERLVEVKRAIEENGFSVLEIISKDDWYCLVARYA
jgi:ribosomal protein L11 methyltransferase